VKRITQNIGFIAGVSIDKRSLMLLSWGRIVVISVNIEKRGISNAEVVDCHGNCVGHSDLDFMQGGNHFDGVMASRLAG
jgi:hypothetical protein